MRLSRLIPLLHASSSLALLAAGAMLPSGGNLGAVPYIASLLFFLINLPGVLLLQLFYTSSPEILWNEKAFVFAGMFLATSALLFLASFIYGKIFHPGSRA